MIHITNPIIKHKAGLLNLAEELGNVSKACKVMGVSRDTFYRYQELVEDGDIENLSSKSRKTPNLHNRVDEATEKAVVDYAIEQSAHGKGRASNELRKIGVFVSAGGVTLGLSVNENKKVKTWKVDRLPIGPCIDH